MRVLVVIAHEDPNAKSTVHRIARATEEALKANGHEVKIVDLIKAGFDKLPTTKPASFGEESQASTEPEVLKHQEEILWCTHYVLMGPIWQYRLPAVFYAYYERVFKIGWACAPGAINENGLLKGRKAMIVATCGGGDEEYDLHGEIGTVEALLFAITFGHLRYCGFKVLRTQAFYDCCPTMKDEEERMNKWKRAVLNLDSRPELPIHPAEPGGLNNIQRIAALPEFRLE